MIRPGIVVAHAAFNEARQTAFAPLRAELERQCADANVPLFVYADVCGGGSLRPWLRCLEWATGWPVSHVTFLPDDAILVPHFVQVLCELIAARPEAIICMQSNHEAAKQAHERGYRWYATDDGFTAFGGTMPVAWVREYLAWRERELRDPASIAGDLSVNIWAMATGRRIYKPLPSLIDHDTTLKSLDGNDHHAELSPRRSLVFDPDADLRGVDWSGKAANIGRTYRGNQWLLMTELRAPMLERAFELKRGGPVSPTPHVYVATPAYGGHVDSAYCEATHAVAQDLVDNGIAVSFDWRVADSLVQRARNRLVQRFLCSPATHLLFWDADVVPLERDYVRRMLATGRPIVGGSYPLKNESGRVVGAPWRQDVDAGKLAVRDGCAEVMDLPTGFMLIERSVLIRMIEAYPETWYASDSPDPRDRGTPLFAMFDGGIVKGRYLSEDYLFCERAQRLGIPVFCFVDAEFLHVGTKAYTASFREQWRDVLPSDSPAESAAATTPERA